MTKKDFNSIAKIIKDIEDFDERFKVALRFVELFKSENPRFSQDKFMEAANCY